MTITTAIIIGFIIQGIATRFALMDCYLFFIMITIDDDEFNFVDGSNEKGIIGYFVVIALNMINARLDSLIFVVVDELIFLLTLRMFFR